MQNKSGTPNSLLDIWRELEEVRLAARSKAQGGDKASDTLLGYVSSMMDLALYPIDSTIYSKVDERDGTAVTPAGYPWLVSATEGNVRQLVCMATGAVALKTIEQLTAEFSLVPVSLPEIYRPDVRLSPAQLDDKYSDGSAPSHPFFTSLQWRHHVAQNRTIYGYWEWLSQQLHFLSAAEAA
ncbi:hypothetical protein [Pseudomonas nitroreducens]|uniref:Uncharacterized protein n=1 Tax=Pseudomonas nitroreducens TaxID=46680 RepID=A0A6G6J7C0_PSENT|nr:hypothetical protein [Pseudomonas nitroreducens]QIE91144.1 hypothetical protein G5B91_32830 [Pseudomonas nitroreducens]